MTEDEMNVELEASEDIDGNNVAEEAVTTPAVEVPADGDLNGTETTTTTFSATAMVASSCPIPITSSPS